MSSFQQLLIYQSCLELTSGTTKCLQNVNAMHFCRMNFLSKKRWTVLIWGSHLIQGGISGSRTGANTYNFRPRVNGKKLEDWLAVRVDSLFENLTDRYILFGEWCYAQHSIYYERLPDWFLGYDVYDKLHGRFLSSTRRDHLCGKTRIIRVPVLDRGRYLLSDLLKLPVQSQLTDQPAEGLYLRYDQGKWLVKRAKLVRPEFIRLAEKHWSRKAIRPNRLRSDIHR